MAFSQSLKVIGFLAAAAHAVPAPMPAPTPAPAFPVTFNPTFSTGATVINGTTYPLVAGGGNFEYTLTSGPNSAQGLGGLYLGLQYTQISGTVYPELAYTLEEGDTESLADPRVGTVVAGGLVPNATTIVVVQGTLGPNAQSPSVSGLAAEITGGFLGQPFTVLGSDQPKATVPASDGGTAILGDIATGLLAYGPGAVGGQIGGSLASAQSFTSAAGGASGSAKLGGLFGQATLGGAYVVSGTRTYAQVCLGLGGEGIGYTECFGPTPPAKKREQRWPAAVPAALTAVATRGAM